jgi:bifunctional non-homologous end joining protein LigD
MLAVTKRVTDVPAGWVVEPKLDGWRAIVIVADGRVVIRSRRGNDLSDRLPELAGLADVVPSGTVLDGELVAGDGRASDFYTLGPRMLSRSRAAKSRWAGVRVSLRVFDVLQHAGASLCAESWATRRSALDALGLCDPLWTTMPVLDAELADAMRACVELDLEGVVLKRADSPYRPGERSKDWIKVKTPDWRERHGARRHEH